jgi:hypothetical protein
MLSTPFDVAVANPPYTDSAKFGEQLKNFIDENYNKPYKCNSNLYASFIRRCWELIHEAGKIAMISPRTFMCIKTFEDLRKFILDKTHINLFVDYGLSNLFGPVMVDPAFYCFERGIKGDYSTFISLDQYTRTPEEKLKKQYCLNDLANICLNREGNRIYKLSQDKLYQIKSYPFIYWISDEFRAKFREDNLDSVLDIRQGLASGNNDRFLRFWWEVSPEKISCEVNDGLKWVRYSKGGPFRKWYGNYWLCIAFDAENYNILSKSGNHLPNRQYYFREGVTYSAVGTKGISFRYLPANFIIDAKGPGIYTNKLKNNWYALGFLNSKLVFYICDSLDSTVSVNQGDIKRVPMAHPNSEQEELITSLSKTNVNIMKSLEKYSIIEYGFQSSPIGTNLNVASSISNYLNYENAQRTRILINEAIINQTVFDIYDLSESDRKKVLDKEGTPVGMLPISNEAVRAFVEDQQGDSALIKQLKDLKIEITNNHPSITNFETLYQKNNDWEEFCIKQNVNPIEVWYQFKKSQILPKQRIQEFAFELLVDVIRSLLAKDDDGVIPLVERTGEGTLTNRIQQEMIERGYSIAQFSQIVNLLGMPLERYLRDRFFAQLSDHLNLFMFLPKTPFIWHITSGPLHAMELYVSIYKWNRNTLSRLKSVYCANRESSLRDRLGALSQNDAPEAQTEAADIRAQLRELDDFAKKLDDLLATGYDPKLDDGVGKNIAPLQQAGLLSCAVLKDTGDEKSQLNKFLNADW